MPAKPSPRPRPALTSGVRRHPARRPGRLRQHRQPRPPRLHRAGPGGQPREPARRPREGARPAAPVLGRLHRGPRQATRDSRSLPFKGRRRAAGGLRPARGPRHYSLQAPSICRSSTRLAFRSRASPSRRRCSCRERYPGKEAEACWRTNNWDRSHFVLRVDGDPPRYHDVQVKTVRSRSTYVFMRKDKFRLTPNLLLALIILDEGGEPEMYLIPATAWRNAKSPSSRMTMMGRSRPPSTGSRCRLPTW